MEIWEWVLLIIVLLLTIAVIVLGVFAIVNPPLASLNQNSKNTGCQSGLICNDANVCKQQIGGSCTESSDCIGEDSECVNNICTIKTSNGLEPIITKIEPNINSSLDNVELIDNNSSDNVNLPQLGEPCTLDNKCAEGLTCQRNLLLYLNGNVIFPSLADSVIDILSINNNGINNNSINNSINDNTNDSNNFNNILFLLNDGNILILQNNKYRLRHSNINLNRIIIFGDLLLGLDDDGRLYQRIIKSNNDNKTWLWENVTWAPVNITHITTTLNGKYLWIQTNNNGLYNGYLYKLIANNDNNTNKIILVRSNVINNIIRIYGNSINSYIDITKNNYTAIRYPTGELIENIYDGVLLDNGELIRIQPNQSSNIQNIRLIRSTNNQLIVVLVTTRKCV